VSLSGRTLIVCRLRSLHSTVLDATCGGIPISLPVDSIAALGREKGSHFWQGATIGMVGGAVVGALIGAVAGYVCGGLIGSLSGGRETYDGAVFHIVPAILVRGGGLGNFGT
jgi:hypothetical protein